MRGGDLNFRWSQVLVRGFVVAGVRHAVISPGSRSTPLALALLREPGLQTHVVVDERSAAFFALGLSRAARQPVLVVATSGSAPANWFPAIVEAGPSGVPLILLSADRPPELVGCGANQTLDQGHLFGAHVRAFQALATPFENFDPAALTGLAVRMVDTACWPAPGPVHLNQPFREPLVPETPAEILPPDLPCPAVGPAVKHLRVPAHEIEIRAEEMAGRRGLILCTGLPADAAWAGAVTLLAGKLDCPILAEPLSNLRFGPHDRSRILVRYDHWLRDPDCLEAIRPDWLLRFGPYPVTRRLQAVASLTCEASLWVTPEPGWQDPASSLTQVLRGDPVAFCHDLAAAVKSPAPASWMAAFRQREMQGGAASIPAPQSPEALTEGALIPRILDVLPDNCPVFVGNSLLIRDLDAESGSGPKSRVFYGNRGVSGIDGNVSTAVGIAAARGRCLAMVGDLTCQHDAGALALARQHTVAILVFNNGGGGIFDHLPQAGLPEFEQGWRAPQALDFVALAQAFEVPCRRVGSTAELLSALEGWSAVGGALLLEIPIDRQASFAFRTAARW